MKSTNLVYSDVHVNYDNFILVLMMVNILRFTSLNLFQEF